MSARKSKTRKPSGSRRRKGPLPPGSMTNKRRWARHYYEDWEPADLRVKIGSTMSRLIVLCQLYLEKTGDTLVPNTAMQIFELLEHEGRNKLQRNHLAKRTSES